MKRIVLVSILLMWSAQLLTAQEFLVMSIKGKVTCEELTGKQKGKIREPQVGDVLKGNCRIRTSFASYIKLMAGRGRLVSVDENRDVKLSALARSLPAGKSGDATGSLLAYAAKQLQRNRSEGASGSVFGAVRGDQAIFEAVFPRLTTLGNQPRFRWVDTDSIGSYSLTLYDDSLRLLRRLAVQGQEVQLTDAEGAPLVHGNYHWRIQRVGDGTQSDIQSFSVLPRDTAGLVLNELSSLDRELRAMHADTVIHLLTRGLYLERRGLLADAYQQYAAASRLEPGVAEYRDIARAILLRLHCISSEVILPR